LSAETWRIMRATSRKQHAGLIVGGLIMRVVHTGNWARPGLRSRHGRLRRVGLKQGLDSRQLEYFLMASRLIHEVHSLIAFGLPYGHVHAKKDAFSRRRPGIRHREVGHRKYRAFGKTWNFSHPFPAGERHRIERVLRWKGPVLAEECMVSMSHDIDDKSWDRDGTPIAERTTIRKHWELFCVWLVLSPDVLRVWAGVDVAAGRIHRLIDGVEVWEDEPTLVAAYASLYNRAWFLIRCNRALREALVKCGKLDPTVLSNRRSQRAPRLKHNLQHPCSS